MSAGEPLTLSSPTIRTVLFHTTRPVARNGVKTRTRPQYKVVPEGCSHEHITVTLFFFCTPWVLIYTSETVESILHMAVPEGLSILAATSTARQPRPWHTQSEAAEAMRRRGL